MYPLLYMGAAPVGVHYSRMYWNDPVPSKTSSSSHKLNKFDSVKTSRSRIHYSRSSSRYTMSPCTVHSSGTAVQYPPQSCTIIGVCVHCVYTVCTLCTPAAVHAADLCMFVLAGALQKLSIFSSILNPFAGNSTAFCLITFSCKRTRIQRIRRKFI